RAPTPDAEPFVEVGDPVDADKVVCIVEAMKVMNEVKAEVPGVIEKIFIESGKPVEYGQPLFRVAKS
ncbi:MAG: acetyl-CoA carboxylase biotin carboxyl carrier protein, partial [Planctomycetota bacterium]